MNPLTISEPRDGVPLPSNKGGRGPLAEALWALAPSQCVDVSQFADADRLMKRVSRYNQIWPARRYQCRKLDQVIRVWRVR